MIDVRRISFLGTPCFLAYVSSLFIGCCMIWGIVEWKRTQVSQEINESEKLLKINDIFRKSRELENDVARINQYSISFYDDLRYKRNASGGGSSLEGEKNMNDSAIRSDLGVGISSSGSENNSRLVRTPASSGSESSSVIESNSEIVNTPTNSGDIDSSTGGQSLNPGSNSGTEGTSNNESPPESKSNLETASTPASDLENATGLKNEGNSESISDFSTDVDSLERVNGSDAVSASTLRTRLGDKGPLRYGNGSFGLNDYSKLEQFLDNHKDFVLSSLANVLDFEMKKQHVLDSLKEVFQNNLNRRDKRGVIEELKFKINEALISEEMKNDIREALAELIKTLDGEDEELDSKKTSNKDDESTIK